MSMLGIHLEPDVAWVAVIDDDGALEDIAVDRVQLPGAVESPERALAEFTETVTDLIRRVQPKAIAVLDAGTGRNPPAAAASRARGHLEAGIMLAAHSTGTAVRHVSHNEVKTTLGHRPTDSQLATDLGSRVSGPVPPRWTVRAKACAAAVVALGEQDA